MRVTGVDIGLLMQLSVTAMGLFTLLAVLAIGVVICRRSNSTVGLYSLFQLFNYHFHLRYKVILNFRVTPPHPHTTCVIIVLENKLKLENLVKPNNYVGI